MDVFCEALASTIKERMVAKKEVLHIKLKNIPTLINCEKFSRDLRVYLDDNADSKNITEKDTESCPGQVISVTSRNKGWICFILLWIWCITGIMIMFFVHWWGIFLLILGSILFMKEMINNGDSIKQFLFSLKLLLGFVFLQIPPTDDENSEDTKCITVYHPVESNKSNTDLFGNLTKELVNNLGITYPKRVINLSKNSQRSDATFCDYSIMKHSRKLMNGNVPAWLVAISLLLVVVFTVAGALYYERYIVGALSFSSLCASVDYICKVLFSVNDGGDIFLDEAIQFIENTCRFYRKIEKANLKYVLVLDNNVNILTEMLLEKLEFVGAVINVQRNAYTTDFHYSFNLKCLNQNMISVSANKDTVEITEFIEWLNATLTNLKNMEVDNVAYPVIEREIKFLLLFVITFQKSNKKTFFNARQACELVKDSMDILMGKYNPNIKLISNDVSRDSEHMIDDCKKKFNDFMRFYWSDGKSTRNEEHESQTHALQGPPPSVTMQTNVHAHSIIDYSSEIR